MNRTVVIDLLANDYDEDGHTLIITGFCSEPMHGLVTTNPDQTISYTPLMDYTGPDEFCYILCDDGLPELCDTAWVFIDVMPLIDPVIHNILTPNGDGKNETLVIDYINQYPENEVYIFNRWGDEMASFTNYDNVTNNWDARNRKTNEIVPTGTYYFIVKITHPTKVFKGWIYVQQPE
jgi:gliding motility-associated-like protein